MTYITIQNSPSTGIYRNHVFLLHLSITKYTERKLELRIFSNNFCAT